MGMLKVKIYQEGSFRPLAENEFTAMNGGHAQAIAEAIEWLAGDVMSDAIKQDHALHDQGEKPAVGFGKRA
jgi:hypothetical protein